MSQPPPLLRCIALHPGTTATDLSAPFQANVKPAKLFPVSKSVGLMLGVLDGLERHHSGGFFAFDGTAIEW